MEKNPFYGMAMAFVLIVSCSSGSVSSQEPITAEQITEEPETSDKSISDGYLVPSNEKQLLFIGQDLRSVRGYVANCTECPVPSGITTYVNLSGVRSGNYGALGWKPDNTAYEEEIEWGAGPLNAYKAATEYPNSAVQIGLYLVGQTQNIAEGNLDDHIKQLGAYFNALKETAFYLRIGYEFDGNWNRYEGERYQKAFRKIVEVLRGEGVTNVAYVWQSSTSPVDDLLDGGREDLLKYYPGDDYVDWFGVSWFLRLDERATATTNTISTQQFLLDEMLALARSKEKPVMIAESANQGYHNTDLTNANIGSIWDGAAGLGGRVKTAELIWEEWYAPYFDYIHKNDDVIRAVSYINANWDLQDLWNAPYENGYWGDSRVEVNKTLMRKWVEEINGTGWLAGGTDLNAFLGLK